MDYPKYEKVNEHAIRIIIEKADEVPLVNLIQTKKQIEEKLVQLEQTLKSINEILAEAEKMGITPEEKDNNTEKNEK